MGEGHNEMGTDLSGSARIGAQVRALSGRARAALQQQQRRIALLERELHGADRILAGALTAGDGNSQQEMLGAYLEAVQELRVSLQRLEAFLLQRLVDPDCADPTERLQLPLPPDASAEFVRGD